MSDATPPAGMQFEQAEFGAPAPLTCATCGNAIAASYYQVGLAITCEKCKRRIQWEATSGSPIGRLLKAAALGTAAAAAGAAVYYAVRALTGYEFGLIAVVVGLVVGGAVRKGSGHRGGIPYQALAMFLTYTSIVSTYVPDLVKAFREQSASQDGGTAAAPAVGAPTVAAPAVAASAIAAAPSVPAPVGGASGAAVAPATGGVAGVVILLLTVVAAIAIAFAAPFLMGFENVIGIVIIGIGLYEAWKMNRKPDRTITGPFRIEDAALAAPQPAP